MPPPMSRRKAASARWASGYEPEQRHDHEGACAGPNIAARWCSCSCQRANLCVAAEMRLKVGGHEIRGCVSPVGHRGVERSLALRRDALRDNERTGRARRLTKKILMPQDVHEQKNRCTASQIAVSSKSSRRPSGDADARATSA